MMVYRMAGPCASYLVSSTEVAQQNNKKQGHQGTIKQLSDIDVLGNYLKVVHKYLE